VHVADLVALIERLGRSPVDLLGHSYGGAVAALLAQSQPDLIRKLVRVDP
jgi:pimeloyl-ACP methyl ester carboxylesterase